ncbi:MAG: NUDIX domain-containing protein [Pseudomonadota bacterium]|nr:NUDIX domain-containing protein [Pseudomonadota bacterium]
MKPSEGGEFVAPLLAATVLLVRDGPDGVQVFMVVRHHKIEFASGALVFPGGKAEPEDRELAGDDAEAVARVAAIRETYEECGVLLARPRDGGALVASTLPFRERLAAENLAPALDALTLFAHWITPPILPKRFDTRFFIAEAPADQLAAHDGGEAVDSIWIEPRKALAEAARGLRTLVLPTRLNLELLGASPTARAAVAAAAARRVTPIEPIATKTPTGYRLSIPPDAGYGGADYEV